MRKDGEKAELFVRRLANVFEPHGIQSDINTSPTYQPETAFKRFTPIETTEDIDNNLNSKKTPEIDGISHGLFKELPRKSIIMFIYLFMLEVCPGLLQGATDNHAKNQTNQKKLHRINRYLCFQQYQNYLRNCLPLKQIKPLISIPDFQFGFGNKHSTVDQIHRVTKVVEKAFEEKKYCTAVFFDRVWHEGLILKISKALPQNYCQLLESYLANRTF